MMAELTRGPPDNELRRVADLDAFQAKAAVAALRRNGYVIVSVEPSAKILKAMAIAMATDDPLIFEMLSDREAEATARAAYGAITAALADEKEGGR
jgi:hypothetical protein